MPGKKIKGLSADVWLSNNSCAICGNFGIGAPAAVTLIEELIACGVKRFVSIGTAGALKNKIELGTVMICNKALSDEGTSTHYSPEIKSGKPSPLLLKGLSDWLEFNNIPHETCKAWTTDAPFRETTEKLNHFIKLGANVVEMEASALYAVAAFRNVHAIAVYIVGDSIANGKWIPEFNSPWFKNRLYEIAVMLIDFLCKLPHPLTPASGHYYGIVDK